MSDNPRGRGRGGRHTDREAGSSGRRGRAPITVSKGGRLPKWVREEIIRSTPKDRRDPAIHQLEQGLAAFAEDRYRQAFNSLRKAKALAPRSSTVRELLGLSAYHIDQWEDALRELRTFRRLTGDTAHVPIEMDCLRALNRSEGVEKTWATFQEVGGSRQADDEARVVYASFLLDRDRLVEAWKVIKPGRLAKDAPESALRRWAVAARVAQASGDRDAARRLVDAIRDADPDVPWLDELERSLA